MSVPELPPELWFRISTFLDAASLSSISRVSKTLNEIATHQSHFRRVIPTTKKCPTHAAQLYRRQRALYHPPSTCLSIQQTSQCKMFCTVQDNLLLLEDCTITFVAFPSGVVYDILEIVGPFTPCVFDQPPFFSLELFMRELYAVLPGGHIAFVYDFRPELLAILELSKEGIVHWEISRNERVSHRRIVDGKAVAAAGNNAEWLIFYSDENTISLFDWRDGTVLQDITNLPNKVKFVMGECPEIDGMSVVGLINEKTDGLMKNVQCKGFDDVEMTFRVDREKSVDVVLRSADKKTHVLVTSIETDGDETMEFVACRSDANGVKRWNGRLDMWTQKTWPELRENGRVIAAKRGTTLMKALDSDGSPKQLWITLKDDETTEITGMPVPSGPNQPKHRTQPVWHRRTHDGGFALMVGEGRDGAVTADVIDLVKIVKDGNESREICLQRWYCRTLTDWCVVADHFIVAKRSYGGTICVYHFDEFCRTAGGVYQCPGLIPERFKVKRRESHTRKRRRTLTGKSS